METDEMNSFVSQLDSNKWTDIDKKILNKKSNKWLTVKNIYFGKNQQNTEEINKISQILFKEIFNYLSNFWPDKEAEERNLYEKVILHSIAVSFLSIH